MDYDLYNTITNLIIFKPQRIQQLIDKVLRYFLCMLLYSFFKKVWSVEMKDCIIIHEGKVMSQPSYIHRNYCSYLRW